MNHDTVPHAAHDLPPVPAEKLTAPFRRFLALSSAGGVLLLICTVIALLWANSGFADAYHYIFHDLHLEVHVGDYHVGHGLAHWINDALMAVFFLVVGLEIKREMLVGELASPRKAALPIFAALGGMIAPAIIYATINWGQPTLHGWGVPMATDIAFALGILMLMGARAPLPLKVFLVSLAIIDDLGALVVIALFYTEDVSTTYLMYALGAVGVMAVFNVMGVRRIIPYIAVGLVLWFFVLESGVHATIAGVLTACCIPASARVDSVRFLRSSRHALDVFEKSEKPGHCVRTNPEQRAAVMALEKNAEHVVPPLQRLEHILHPYAAFMIIPLFSVANAGLHLGAEAAEAATSPITIGVVSGLLFGKPIGIFLACFIAVKFGIAALPTGVSWKQLLGVGFLGGIGFTMALFIGNLAFADPHHLEAAKLGIMLASLLSTIVGVTLLMLSQPATDTADSAAAEPSPA